ncbi:MAG: divalent-cation tolerance protein CutA [Candidatus Micrarchaeota archaeon]
MTFIMCYITNSSRKEAQKIAKHLIKKRICACSNIFPISSMCWWKGKIESADEWVVIAKTKKENWKKVKQEVKKITSYETPCIIKINAEANDDYEKWLKKEVR